MNLSLGLDVDDVILQYKKHFIRFMESQNYIPQIEYNKPHRFDLSDVFPGYPISEILQKIREFSYEKEFSEIEEYDGFSDAIREIKKNFKTISLIAITSPGDHPITVENRLKNLSQYPFDAVHITPLLESKKSHLRKLPKKTVYIDDSYTHIKTAEKLNLQGILFRQPTNVNDNHSKVMSCWRNDLNFVLKHIELSYQRNQNAKTA